MRVVNQAKTHLSKLVEAVEGSEEMIIARAGKPVARLVPLQRPRQLGLLRGRLTVPENFDTPLPEEILAAFEGGA